jgi:DNA-directed RNA polymerase specialized sigma24 family protein
VKVLNDNQKEILYLRVIRQWSPQKIAAMRGQTDRNIRKVYDTLINGLRKKLKELADKNISEQ